MSKLNGCVHASECRQNVLFTSALTTAFTFDYDRSEMIEHNSRVIFGVRDGAVSRKHRQWKVCTIAREDLRRERSETLAAWSCLRWTRWRLRCRFVSRRRRWRSGRSWTPWRRLTQSPGVAPGSAARRWLIIEIIHYSGPQFSLLHREKSSQDYNSIFYMSAKKKQRKR